MLAGILVLMFVIVRYWSSHEICIALTSVFDKLQS